MGKATIVLRPGSHYDIEAVANRPDFSQACAEPLGVDVHPQSAPAGTGPASRLRQLHAL